MLPMSELEYGGVVDKMSHLDERFIVREEEPRSVPDGGNGRKKKAA
jgi:hypothetical protein